MNSNLKIIVYFLSHDVQKLSLTLLWAEILRLFLCHIPIIKNNDAMIWGSRMEKEIVCLFFNKNMAKKQQHNTS